MKKILILGGSHRDIPLIKASQELGYFVITLGDRDSYLGHKYSDKAIKIDFNNLEKVRAVIKNEKIDYLLPGCGEESYLSTVALANELHVGNFDTIEVANIVHNKWKFKEFCLSHNISTTKGSLYTPSLELESMKFPAIVKPTNLSGGRGVKIIETTKEFNLALQRASSLSNEIFLEEFIDGELIAYSIFLKNQNIIYGFLGKDDTYLNPYLITTAYPILIDEDILEHLKNDIEIIAQQLNLVDGMFHLQIIIKENIPYIIDVTRRIAGDFYPNLIEYCDGVNYSKSVVKAYLGVENYSNFDIKYEQSFIIRHCVMPSKNGIYKEINIDDSLKNNIIDRFDLLQTQEIVEDYLHTQIAIIFIKLDKRDSYIIENINDLIYPIIQEE